MVLLCPNPIQINALNTFLQEEIKTLSFPLHIFSISIPIIVNLIFEKYFFWVLFPQVFGLRFLKLTIEKSRMILICVYISSTRFVNQVDDHIYLQKSKS